MSLIDELIDKGHLKTAKAIEAFRKIKRQDFVSPEDKHGADENSPLGLGQTISQPAAVVFRLEKLQPK